MCRSRRRDAGLEPGERDDDLERRPVVLDAELVGRAFQAEAAGPTAMEPCGGFAGDVGRGGEKRQRCRTASEGGRV